MFYAEPRFTNDIDIVVRIPAAGGPALRAAFPEPDFYRPSVDEISLELGRRSRGHLNVIHLESGLKADLYLAGTDPLNEWALASARSVETAGSSVSVAPPEYVIVRKLAYFREGGSEKHVRDIRGMLELAVPQIDRAALLDRLDEEGLGELFRRLFPGSFP